MASAGRNGEAAMTLISRFRGTALRFSVNRGVRRAMREVRHGCRYEPVGWIEVDASELRVRREPLLIPKNPRDLHRIYEVDAWKVLNPIERFFPIRDGRQDRRLCHTPHYQLLQEYHATGIRRYEHDYTRLILARARAQGRSLDDDFLRWKVDSLCSVFDSIRENGYLAGRYSRFPIVVFESSIHPPAGTYVPEKHEVFDGHHRAAAAALLELEKIRVFVIRPIRVQAYDMNPNKEWDESLWPRKVFAGG